MLYMSDLNFLLPEFKEIMDSDNFIDVRSWTDKSTVHLSFFHVELNSLCVCDHCSSICGTFSALLLSCISWCSVSMTRIRNCGILEDIRV